MERNRRRIGLAGLAAGLAFAGVVVAPQAFGGTQPVRLRDRLTQAETQQARSQQAGTKQAGTKQAGTKQAQAQRAGTDAAGCADVHIIATRASTERPGAGIIGSLVNAVKGASDQSVSTATTDYPATLSNYTSSEAKGVAALKQLVETQAQQCPQQKLVLMGYSQGAQVTGDVLAGTARSAPAKAGTVAAVILMGDPAFVPGKSFNAGTSTRAGVFPRGAARSLDAFADRIQSYCDTGDNFCASGNNVAVHLGYTRKYNAVAEKFVLAAIGG